MSIDEQNISEDSLFEGELKINQFKDGYRFSIDAILLAQFIQPKKNSKILDMGCGCGVVGLIICYRNKNRNVKITSLEIQRELANLTCENIKANGFDDFMSLVEGDAREYIKYFQYESFDQIVANPPFYAIGTGRVNCGEQSFKARHQVCGGLEDYLLATSKLLKNKGVAVFIYPAEQLTEFLIYASRVKLEPKKLQLIYNYPNGDKPASLFMVICVKNGGSNVEVVPPLYIYNEKNGVYSHPVSKFYEVNKK